MDLLRPRLRRNEGFCQVILLGKVTVQMLSGQRGSSVECGAEGGEVKGTLFCLVGGEERRLRKAHREFDQRSQGHSASPRGRNRGKMGRESADSELEWNSSGIRS